MISKQGKRDKDMCSSLSSRPLPTAPLPSQLQQSDPAPLQEEESSLSQAEGGFSGEEEQDDVPMKLELKAPVRHKLLKQIPQTDKLTHSQKVQEQSGTEVKNLPFIEFPNPCAGSPGQRSPIHVYRPLELSELDSIVKEITSPKFNAGKCIKDVEVLDDMIKLTNPEWTKVLTRVFGLKWNETRESQCRTCP